MGHPRNFLFVKQTKSALSLSPSLSVLYQRERSGGAKLRSRMLWLTTSAMNRTAAAPTTRSTSSNDEWKSSLVDATASSTNDIIKTSPNVFLYIHRQTLMRRPHSLVAIPVRPSNNRAIPSPKSAAAIEVMRYIAAATETKE